MNENKTIPLPQQVKDVTNSITTLNSLIETCQQTESHFRNNQNEANGTKLLRVTDKISQQYQESIRLVDALIASLKNLIEKSSLTNDNTETSIPSTNRINDLLKIFFLEQPKLSSSPYPPHTGCYAFRKKTDHPKKDSFVCARQNDKFILMIIIGSENKLVDAIDTSDVEDNVEPIKLENVDWTPMPVNFPEKPQSRWEHAINSFVLSLYKTNPSVNDSWTKQFFRAQIKQRPCDITDDSDRGYMLDFGDGIQQKVPEQFVSNIPKEWVADSQKALLSAFFSSNA